MTALRLAMAWALFWAGDALSRLPRYPYAIYHRLMVWSNNLQKTGERGPWKDVK